MEHRNGFGPGHGSSLETATVQQIQMELIRRHQFNLFNGKQIAEDLLAHPELWEAALFDRPSLRDAKGLLQQDLIKLRDLNMNVWNVDTLFILCPGASEAHRLAEVAEEWRADEIQIDDHPATVNNILGDTNSQQAILTLWWD